MLICWIPEAVHPCDGVEIGVVRGVAVFWRLAKAHVQGGDAQEIHEARVVGAAPERADLLVLLQHWLCTWEGENRPTPTGSLPGRQGWSETHVANQLSV